jgi:MT0933-like antitoxin protein
VGIRSEGSSSTKKEPEMGLDDLKDQAAQSGMQEKVSDAAIDKAGDAADAKTGGGHGEQIDKAQQAADQKIGE